MKVNKLYSVFFCLLFALFFPACTNQEEVTETNSKYYLYYLDSTGNKIVKEPYEPKSATKEDLILELIYALDLPATNSSYKNAKPADVLISQFTLVEEEQLLLDFDASYQNLHGIEEILCRAVIVRTLCQVEGVEYVEFYVNEQPLMVSKEILVGRMKSGDFIDNTGANTNFSQSSNIKIYFANEAGTLLKESLLIVENDGSRTMQELVLEQLIRGPLDEQTDLYPVIPEDTVLNKVTTKDGICYVDFNEAFLNKREGLTDEVALYAVVNSLVEISGITQVRFTINGEPKKNYQNLDFDVFFERNLSLIESEKAGES